MKTICKKIYFTCNIAVSFIAITVLVGWYMHVPVLIQIFPGWAPMQFNTAMGFLLCGSGGIGIYFSRLPWVRALGVALVFLATLTLGEYVLGVSFGIDELFMKHYILTKTSHPGRMAPNTALCFLLFGIFLITSAWIKDPPKNSLVTGIQGALVFALSTVVFSGYLAKLESAYGWGSLSQMAVHTASGFILLGLGMVTLALAISAKEKKEGLELIPTLIGVGAITATVLLWQAQYAAEQKNIQEKIQVYTEKVKNEIVTGLNPQIDAMKRMARRMEGHFDEQEWKRDAEHYHADYGNFQAVEWVDFDNYVRWIVPLEGNKEALGLKLSFESHREEALQLSKELKQPVISQAVNLVQGGQGFLVFSPVFKNGKFFGSILAVFKTDVLIKSLLNKFSTKDLHVSIHDSSGKIFETASDMEPASHSWSYHKEINFHGTQWKAQVFPSSEWLEKEASFLPQITLTLGIILSILLSLSIYFRGKAVSRS